MRGLAAVDVVNGPVKGTPGTLALCCPEHNMPVTRKPLV